MVVSLAQRCKSGFVGLVLLRTIDPSLAGLIRYVPRQVIAAALTLVLLAMTGAEADARTRTLKLFNTHTHERLTITFKKNGRYIPSALRELNRFLRDWRRNESTNMDPQLFDLVWEVYQKSGARKPIHVVSGYRSLTTNNMLRRRSRGVARFSQHTQGRAMDFFLPDVPVSKLRKIGLRKQTGGVGYYPTSRSPFVHMDTGRVRHWPRMTRQQLVRVFPEGKTLHVPSDGKPLPGYKIALARYKAKKRQSRTVLASARPSRVPTPAGRGDERFVRPSGTVPASAASTTFASLFSTGERARPVRSGPKPPAGVKRKGEVVVASLPSASGPMTLPGVDEGNEPKRSRIYTEAGKIPMPRRRPETPPVVVASLPESSAPDSGEPLSDAGQPVVAALPAQRPVTEDKVDPFAATIAREVGGVPIPAAAPSAALAYAPASDTGAAKPTRAGKAAKYRLASFTPPTMTDADVAPAPRPSRFDRTFAMIHDPLAKLRSVEYVAPPAVYSNHVTTRMAGFTGFEHPDLKIMPELMTKPAQTMTTRFQRHPATALRSDRFSGPALQFLTTVAMR